MVGGFYSLPNAVGMVHIYYKFNENFFGFVL